MIATKDRRGWFGASDTSYVVGNWETKTFRQWWLTKLGLHENNLTTKAMKAGTAYEHRILDAYRPGIRKDHQILLPELRLRVNYDGDDGKTIYEVKTFRGDKEFKVSKSYWRQAQAEMYAYGTTELYILAYPLGDQEYKNYFSEIDVSKIQIHKIDYDIGFVEDEYLPKLRVLKECLEAGRLLWKVYERG